MPYFSLFVFLLFRTGSLKIQDLMLKFPHLPEKVFQKLDSESLFKSREVERCWQNIIDGKNYPWLRIVNIPTLLKARNSYAHHAAETGQIEEFKTAFNKEEDKNLKNEFGETPIHVACKNGRFKIVQLILKNTDMKINVNAKDETNFGHTALDLACIRGHSDVIKILMENAALLRIDLNAKNNFGMPAFLWAFHHADVVKIFMENAATLGIDLNAKGGITNVTAFHQACEQGNSNVVKIFMKNAASLGIDLNAKDYAEWTGFHHACEQGHADVVKILMKNAAFLSIDLNAEDKDSSTAFHLACRRGQLGVVKIFMESAATLNIDLNRKNKYGWTAFSMAYQNDYSDVVKILENNAAVAALSTTGLQRYKPRIIKIGYSSIFKP